MTKKHKFIDTLKSWLLTLGVASVFGLVALGVNSTKSYTKTSAYDYEDNGTLVFDLSSDFDVSILYNFGLLANEEYLIKFDFVTEYVTGGYSYACLNDNGSVVYYSSLDNGDLYIFYNDGSYELQNDYEYTSMSISFGSIGYQDFRNYALSYNVPQSDGNFLSALTDFMQLLGGAIVQLAQPVANGVTEFARDLFIDNNHLSILGGVIGIFAGIALAVGITTKVYTWVTSLGN